MDKPKQKVLILRLGAIGDVVHTTIIAQAIKQQHPHIEVHFLTDKSIKPLLELSPYVDKIYEFDKSKRNNIFYLLKLGLELRKQRYEVIFNLSHTLRNIIITKISNCKNIIRRDKSLGHAVNTFFNTAKTYFTDLKKPQKLTLKMTEDLRKSVEKKIGNAPRPYFVFNVGGANDAERQGRIWAKENWLELGQKISQKYGGTIFVCGSKAERKNHEFLKSIKNTVLLSGELSLLESSALYTFSDLMISGDSGPLHIADAMDVNLVTLMGSTPPKYCGPYSNEKYVAEPEIECKYCRKKKCKILPDGEIITPCMKSISTDKVLELVDLALKNMPQDE